MRDVALEVPLCPLPIGRRGERNDSNEAWVQQSRHPLAKTALAGCIPTLEQDNHPQTAMPDPLLELEQVYLEAAKLFVIVLSRKDAPTRGSFAFFLVP